MGAYLRRAEPKIRDDADWEKLMHLARIHSVEGVLGQLCVRWPICPEQYRNELLTKYRRTVMIFMQRGTLADNLIRELEQAGIDHILMKGYVLRDYYPVPELRTYSDIDLVIRQEDRKRCHELMLTLGFQVKTDWEPVFSYSRDKEYYEIHTQMMEVDVSEKADCKGYFQDPWPYAKPVSKHSFRFTPEYHFLYMLTHIAKHIHGSGAGVRMYLDVAAFITHFGPELNWTWIRCELEGLKLWDFAQVVFAASEQWFGVKAPLYYEVPASAVMETFTEFTMEAGTFGHTNRAGALTQMKCSADDGMASRWKLIMKRAFPAAQSIQTRYTYLQERPWLLPAAWVHRLVKTRTGFGRHAKEVREILDADSGAIARLRKITKDIGL